MKLRQALKATFVEVVPILAANFCFEFTPQIVGYSKGERNVVFVGLCKTAKERWWRDWFGKNSLKS